MCIKVRAEAGGYNAFWFSLGCPVMPPAEAGGYKTFWFSLGSSVQKIPTRKFFFEIMGLRPGQIYVIIYNITI